MLDIIFEDKYLIVVNKPCGVVVNKSETTSEPTLQDEVSEYLNLQNDNLGIGDRAGIVHRLDRETSGIILIAKDENTFLFLQNQFKNREVEKEYIGLAHGKVNLKSGLVDEPIGRVGAFGKFGVIKNGKEAQTSYRIISEYKINKRFLETLFNKNNITKNRKRYLEKHACFYSLVSFFPKTGRTHQIRVHAKSIGLPLVSDSLYCPSKLFSFDKMWCPRLFLHSKSIKFYHPKNKKILSFSVDLPKDLKSAILNLEEI